MSNPQPYGQSMKSKGGPARLFNALRYTWDGLRAAAKHEEAFKQELMVVVPLSIIAWFVPVSFLEKALLFSCLQLILIVELINSAIERIPTTSRWSATLGQAGEGHGQRGGLPDHRHRPGHLGHGALAEVRSQIIWAQKTRRFVAGF